MNLCVWSDKIGKLTLHLCSTTYASSSSAFSLNEKVNCLMAIITPLVGGKILYHNHSYDAKCDNICPISAKFQLLGPPSHIV